MTDRLYYDQTYLTRFEAVVTGLKPADGESVCVSLDRSAFYPTSGGQPYDTGTLNGLAVTDVSVDAGGEVWHTVPRGLSVGDRVTGVIDWARRFDHMQQHAGEHMIAGTIWRLYRGHTIGLHLGAAFSTIDVEMPDGATHLDAKQIARIEDEVNDRIQRNVPIRCWFPDADELKALPLRKPPTVTEHVRIVAIGDDEMVACGGTHPKSAGEIGLAKIIDARPSKGKVRVAFVCGRRALSDYQARFQATEQAGALLSTRSDKIPEAVARLQDENSRLSRALNAAREAIMLSRQAELLAGAESVNGARVVAQVFDDCDMNSLRTLAGSLTGSGDVIALLAGSWQGKYQIVFARGAGAAADMNRLFKAAAASCGAKGGGRADFAQGSAPDGTIVEKARELLRKGEMP